ncbi:RNA-guided endonuclease InsQ/TnpB family protein [Actinomadura madurae]|uniref:RNA-guided endonuclease InsQ/TnpB family protein n=1 Tax=Actinomadura madurae TaxID=1993 RepID=UPI000DD00C70|nr:RNA-guided endonuclease TnpB family protein [Actinomadura madurae]
MRMAYKCRAYPDPDQTAALTRTFGCVRLVWNKTLAERHNRYRSHGMPTSYRQTDAALTAWKQKPELAFLKEVSSVPLQQTLRHQHAAFQAFFAGRSRYPRYKTRTGRQSAHFTRSAFRMRDGQLWLAKTGGPLKLVWSWPEVDLAALNPTTVVVSQEPDGRWFVTLAVDRADPAPAASVGGMVALDLGLKDFAVTSEGERIGHPKHMQRHEQRLKRYQRQMARKTVGSQNRRKARRKVARQHARVRDARRDFLHKTSTNLVRRYDVIVIEDLNVSGLVQNRCLARAISCTGWAEFRSLLEYKAAWLGRRLVVIDRWYPSSKTCSACGHLLGHLHLGTRHWECPECGTRHDRDINAAKNILAAGLAVTACGAGARPAGASLPGQSAAKQEARSVREGIHTVSGDG